MFIYGIEQVAPWVSVVRPVIEGLGTGAVQAVTSEVTLAEVLVRPIRDADATAHQAFDRTIRSHGGLTVLPVSRAVLAEAARLRVAARLQLPDAIHGATARQSGAEVFLTNDVGIKAIPGVEVVRLAEV